MEATGAKPLWLEPLVRVALDWREGSSSIRQLFEQAAPDLSDPRFEWLVRERLRNDPALIDAWQNYSYDKRGSPSPYLDRNRVGFFEVVGEQPTHSAVRNHKNPVDACADFIHREAAWVLERRNAPGGAIESDS
jgi:hypothetical protein